MSIDSPFSFRAVRFKLEAAGFSGITQKGNHAKFIKRDGSCLLTAIVPHYQELAPDVVASIFRQAKIAVGEFDNNNTL